MSHLLVHDARSSKPALRQEQRTCFSTIFDRSSASPPTHAYDIAQGPPDKPVPGSPPAQAKCSADLDFRHEDHQVGVDRVPYILHRFSEPTQTIIKHLRRQRIALKRPFSI
jgi:hypothetical protein